MRTSALIHGVMSVKSWRTLAMVLIALGLSAPAFADDPFEMESSNWMSFNRYKEKPANWLAPEDRAQTMAAPVVAPVPTLPPDMPLVTAPTRPVSAPTLPGVNKDFDVRVDSTAAEDYPLPLTQSTDTTKPPSLDLQDKRWKDAAFVARFGKDTAKKSGETDENTPLDVRFATLPAMIVPPAKKAATTVLAQTPTPPPPAAAKETLPVVVASPPPADPAACAAIEAYKKRQLAAIESDRKTLTALQAAIAELGLQKQLDFMVGAGGNVNATAPDVAPSAPAKN